MQPYISTHKGAKLDLLNPRRDQIRFTDIAEGLAKICRFTGQCEGFYSVAEHSVRMSYIVPPEEALNALMHDAPEAYLGDVSSPLKQLLPEYRAIYDRLESVIFDVFCVRMTTAVKKADLQMLAFEKHHLMPNAANERWEVLEGVEMARDTHPKHGIAWQWWNAKAMFIHRFSQLTRNREGI